MNIEWNRVTKLSQIVAVVLFVAIFFVGFYVGRKYERTVVMNNLAKDLGVQANDSSNKGPKGMMEDGTMMDKPLNTVSFSCDSGKSITAGFYESKVSLALSDGRKVDLAQVLSASGVRYSDIGEKIVFSAKGESAFLDENGVTTYKTCFAKY